MARSIQIFLPEQDSEWLKAALNTLADDVIADEEAGQRGAKVSVMIRMIASAYIGNVTETTRLMMEIKELQVNRSWQQEQSSE